MTAPCPREPARCRPRSRGAALMMALAALVIISALGTALTMAVMRSISSSRRRASRDEMLNAAESGVASALSRLATLATDPRETAADAPAMRIDVPGGECSVAVKAVEGGAYEITSRACCPGRSLGVRVKVRRTKDGRFAVASWEQLP